MRISKNGTPKVMFKVKNRGVPKDKWAKCYRVFRDGALVGWQWEKPKGYRETPYFGAVRDPKQFFWPEGEKDAVSSSCTLRTRRGKRLMGENAIGWRRDRPMCCGLPERWPT